MKLDRMVFELNADDVKEISDRQAQLRDLVAPKPLPPDSIFATLRTWLCDNLVKQHHDWAADWVATVGREVGEVFPDKGSYWVVVR